MKIDRRQFLKGILYSSGLAVIVPGNLLKMFPDLPKPEEAKNSGFGIGLEQPSAVALGLGYVRVGGVSEHITQIDSTLSDKNSSLGMANVKFFGSTQWTKRWANDSDIDSTFQYVFELECSFQKRLHFYGKSGRVEARFIYPGDDHYMDIILPKAEVVWVKIIDKVYTVLFRATPVTNKVWSDHPYGMIKWV